jgi:hypothetical protein
MATLERGLRCGLESASRVGSPPHTMRFDLLEAVMAAPVSLDYASVFRAARQPYLLLAPDLTILDANRNRCGSTSFPVCLRRRAPISKTATMFSSAAAIWLKAPTPSSRAHAPRSTPRTPCSRRKSPGRIGGIGGQRTCRRNQSVGNPRSRQPPHRQGSGERSRRRLPTAQYERSAKQATRGRGIRCLD